MTEPAREGVQSVADLVTGLVGDRADGWDRAGRLPLDVIREAAGAGVLCPEVPAEFGGLGLSSASAGALTAHVGSLCSSLRSLMTSQGMAAWVVQRFGDPKQRAEHLAQLASGAVAGVAFSEPAAGSDLSAMATRIEHDGDRVTVTGHKVWVTAGGYADRVIVFGRYGAGAAAVVVPTSADGVTVELVPDPLGCRAAGHADIRLDNVRLPADHMLGGAGAPLEWLVTTALTHGRLSVAWGCVGILRACLTAVAGHVATRVQFGRPLVEHQLVARHVAELHLAERAATRLCEHASRCWDDGTPELVSATVAAKHFSAGAAATGASAAVQVLASAGARDGHPVARAYRDAKLMELIEGTNEISQLMLARHAVTEWS